jgi:hypothetical protein
MEAKRVESVCEGTTLMRKILEQSRTGGRMRRPKAMLGCWWWKGDTAAKEKSESSLSIECGLSVPIEEEEDEEGEEEEGEEEEED